MYNNKFNFSHYFGNWEKKIVLLIKNTSSENLFQCWNEIVANTERFKRFYNVFEVAYHRELLYNYGWEEKMTFLSTHDSNA